MHDVEIFPIFPLLFFSCYASSSKGILPTCDVCCLKHDQSFKHLSYCVNDAPLFATREDLSILAKASTLFAEFFFGSLSGKIHNFIDQLALDVVVVATNLAGQRHLLVVVIVANHVHVDTGAL